MFFNQVGAFEEGSTFGEMALFEESHVREFTVKAKTFCELFTLDSQSFDKTLVTLYGEDAGMIWSYAPIYNKHYLDQLKKHMFFC